MLFKSKFISTDLLELPSSAHGTRHILVAKSTSKRQLKFLLNDSFDISLGPKRMYGALYKYSRTQKPQRKHDPDPIHNTCFYNGNLNRHLAGNVQNQKRNKSRNTHLITKKHTIRTDSILFNIYQQYGSSVKLKTGVDPSLNSDF